MPDGDAPDADGFDEWVAEARAREAADARTRERWLRQQASEEARFDDVVNRLAEGGHPVVVTTDIPTRRDGRIEFVGRDHVVLATRAGVVLVALGAITTVTPAPAAGPARPLVAKPGPGLLVDRLAEMAAERETVQVGTRGGLVRGALWSVGRDVVELRVDGEPRVVYVRLASISEISLLESG